ncbi:hypothetical protein [Halosimplex salinum]|uniref:hypothetical protein n=1 Tax=Halosimplex salinum TaxID=1710538 RepID=UPI000F4A5CEC|nr:hypothetical protein [Halosimplex salinum]
MDSSNGGVGGESTGLDRRSVLKLVGAGAVGITATTGTASAWQFQFYGCSQVCSDSRNSRAVVAVDGGYECREMKEYNSDRQNQDWAWASACYEVSGDESVVGIVETCNREEPEFCENPNNCASNHYGTVDEVVAELNEIGCCKRDIVPGSCDVSGTGNGGNDDENSGDENADGDEDSNGDENGNKGGNGDENGNKGGNGDENGNKGGNGDENGNKGGNGDENGNKGGK